MSIASGAVEALLLGLPTHQSSTLTTNGGDAAAVQYLYQNGSEASAPDAKRSTCPGNQNEWGRTLNYLMRARQRRGVEIKMHIVYYKHMHWCDYAASWRVCLDERRPWPDAWRPPATTQRTRVAGSREFITLRVCQPLDLTLVCFCVFGIFHRPSSK